MILDEVENRGKDGYRTENEKQRMGKSRAFRSVVRGSRQPTTRSGLGITVLQLRCGRVGKTRLVDGGKVGRRLGVFNLRVVVADFTPLFLQGLLFDEREHLAKLLERDRLHRTMAGGL